MRSGTQFGFEDWLPRRAALLTALGVWTAGFALAGASAWRMQHPTGTDEMNETFSSAAATSCASCDNAPSDAPADTTESKGVVFMPEDGIVARATPRIGAQLQKP